MDYNSVKLSHKCFCSPSGSVASATSSSSRSSNGISDKQGLKTIFLKRQSGIYLEGSGKSVNKLYPNVKPNNFGFSFRGGKEFGTGFFVSVVEKESEAHYKGLKDEVYKKSFHERVMSRFTFLCDEVHISGLKVAKEMRRWIGMQTNRQTAKQPGDQIIRINGLPVDDATHQEVLQLAQAYDQLTLTVKSIGIIPVKDKNDDPITWKVIDPISDSQQLTAVGYEVDRVFIEIPENTQLGCGICKGPEWRPGIFIQYTKPNSLARRCGLQPGDQILQCNKISFLHIDFVYAVSVLKNAKTLDLVLKKGSGIDLFPGESSGYSSSSSIADETVNQSPSKPKRLSIVAEEGEEKGQRKSCQCESVKNGMKPFGSIDSIFDNFSTDVSTFREKSKSIEILTDSNAKKTVSFGNDENLSKTFLHIKPREPYHCAVGSQTVINIENKDSAEPKKTNMFVEGERVISVEMHRPDDKCGSEKSAIQKSPSSSSFSSSCSLSSAISQEIQRRKEKRLKGNNSGKLERKDSIKPMDRQQRYQHDLLIAELKKKQKWEDKSTVSTQTENQKVDQHPQMNVRQSVHETSFEPKPYVPPQNGLFVDSPPACPTPDYFSDTSLTDQSIEASHAVKTSILKFEERNKFHHVNGSTKTVTFGQNSTKEISPVKNIEKGSNKSFTVTDAKKSQHRVEMQSIESHDLTEPKQMAPKPPPVYFQPSSQKCTNDSQSAQTTKKTTVIKITEYPTDKRREPSKFDFIHRNSESNGFERELASTLSRSNLKNKMDAFANLSNKSVVKIGNEKMADGVIGRCNGFHAVPPVIPTKITENQISSVKKALKTFEKNTNNTVVFKIPKIN